MREFLFGRFGRRFRDFTHGAFILCWFYYDQIVRDLGGDAYLLDIASRVGMTPGQVARILMGTAPRNYYNVTLVHRWCMLLSYSWLEQRGPALFMMLPPSGEIVIQAYWPEMDHLCEDPLIRARRDYRFGFLVGRPLEDIYGPIYESQKRSPSYEKRAASTTRKDSWTPTWEDATSSLLDIKNPSPSLVKAYEDAWLPYELDQEQVRAHHAANPFCFHDEEQGTTDTVKDLSPVVK